MTHLPRFLMTAALAVTLLLGSAGCSRSRAPEAIAADDLPAESQNVFDRASGAVKRLADQAQAALAARDWTGAWHAFQALSERSDLTPEQRQFVASAVMTVGEEMQKAIAEGDARAEAARQMHRQSK